MVVVELLFRHWRNYASGCDVAAASASGSNSSGVAADAANVADVDDTADVAASTGVAAYIGAAAGAVVELKVRVHRVGVHAE